MLEIWFENAREGEQNREPSGSQVSRELQPVKWTQKVTESLLKIPAAPAKEWPKRLHDYTRIVPALPPERS